MSSIKFQCTGITPACAGKRRIHLNARGKGKKAAFNDTALGITPACAGKSRRQQSAQTSSRDHPRLRGEKRSHRQESESYPGSPPLARGKGFNVAWYKLGVRITPACAGKRCRDLRFAMAGWDHPRLRGEKSCACRLLSCRPGSPPLARGKAPVLLPKVFIVGITPACAGKSSPERIQATLDRDHPRLRGEKEKFAELFAHHVGSPPLARGKVTICRQHPRPRGITPACAGKRALRPSGRGAERDHPRLRGEKSPAFASSGD